MVCIVKALTSRNAIENNSTMCGSKLNEDDGRLFFGGLSPLPLLYFFPTFPILAGSPVDIVSQAASGCHEELKGCQEKRRYYELPCEKCVDSTLSTITWRENLAAWGTQSSTLSVILFLHMRAAKFALFPPGRRRFCLRLTMQANTVLCSRATRTHPKTCQLNPFSGCRVQQHHDSQRDRPPVLEQQPSAL